MDALIFVGLPFEYGGKLYNVAAALCRGKILGLVPKTSIPSYREFYEGRHFLPAGPEQALTVRLGKEEVPFGSSLLFDCVNVARPYGGCGNLRGSVGAGAAQHPPCPGGRHCDRQSVRQR